MKIQRFFRTKKGVVTTTYRQDYRQEGIQLIPGLYGVMVDILSYPQCTKKQIWEAVTLVKTLKTKYHRKQNANINRSRHTWQQYMAEICKYFGI